MGSTGKTVEEANYMTVDSWYDRRTRSWVIQKKDEHGNQVGAAEYVGTRAEKDSIVNEWSKPLQDKTSEATQLPISRSKVNDYIKDFTPNMFLGGELGNEWSKSSLQDTGSVNAPNTINVGGYEFQSMGAPTVEYDPSDKKMQTAIMNFDYQSSEQVGDEYPVLSIAIRVKTSKRGTKTEIIKDGYYKTKFW